MFASLAIHGLPLGDAFALVIGYDLLAFATQFAFGLVTDRLRAPRQVTVAGIVLTGLGAAFMPLGALPAMLLVGLGNALFHVGASVFALSASPGRAAPAGVFVAPGALGLGLGLYIGRTGHFTPWPFVAVLAAALLVTLLMRPPELVYARACAARMQPRPRCAMLIVLLLLLSITVRAFVGMGGAHACPKGKLVAMGIPLAAFAGKALGGYAADRLGWVRAGVGALLVSAPLIAFGGANVAVILVGLFFFQMTMPVTLVAAVRVTPHRPGFAFGLTAGALVVGSLPSFFDEVQARYSPPLFLVLILASAAALFGGLRLLDGVHEPKRSVTP